LDSSYSQNRGDQLGHFRHAGSQKVYIPYSLSQEVTEENPTVKKTWDSGDRGLNPVENPKDV
jgi:hypothetical protein